MLYQAKWELNLNTKAQMIFISVGLIDAAILGQLSWRDPYDMYRTLKRLMESEQELQQSRFSRISKDTISFSSKMGALLIYGLIATAVIFWLCSINSDMVTNTCQFVERMAPNFWLLFRIANIFVWYSVCCSSFIIAEGILALASLRVSLLCCHQGIQNA